jgi:hypothetical protein
LEVYSFLLCSAGLLKVGHVQYATVLTDVTLVGTWVDVDKLKKTFYAAIHFDRNTLKT